MNRTMVVAQIFNLPYRRFSIGRPSVFPLAYALDARREFFAHFVYFAVANASAVSGPAHYSAERRGGIFALFLRHFAPSWRDRFCCTVAPQPLTIRNCAIHTNTNY